MFKPKREQPHKNSQSIDNDQDVTPILNCLTKLQFIVIGKLPVALVNPPMSRDAWDNWYRNLIIKKKRSTRLRMLVIEILFLFKADYQRVSDDKLGLYFIPPDREGSVGTAIQALEATHEALKLPNEQIIHDLRNRLTP